MLFLLQISRVPGYEERLKAMLFKVNFAEKVEEVKAVSSIQQTPPVKSEDSCSCWTAD